MLSQTSLKRELHDKLLSNQYNLVVQIIVYSLWLKAYELYSLPNIFKTEVNFVSKVLVYLSYEMPATNTGFGVRRNNTQPQCYRYIIIILKNI